MSLLDLNAPCFCGVGKKIKFCCKDIAADLEKIIRALEGRQYDAAMRMIDKSLQAHPDRPSLWALKLQVVSHLSDTNAETMQVARDFLAHAPENPVALAMVAVARLLDEEAIRRTIEEDQLGEERYVEETVALLHSALEHTDASAPPALPVVDALNAIGQMLIRTGYVPAGIGHLRLSSSITGKADQATQTLLTTLRNPKIPVVAKLVRPIPRPVDWVNWKEAYIEAVALADRGAWTAAADRVAQLIEQCESHETLLRAHAALRCRLPNHARAAAALRAMAEHRGVSEEDAIDALQLAWILETPDGDAVDYVEVTIPVDDVEGLMERMLSDRRIKSRSGDLAMVEREEQTPQGAYLILDRPLPSGESDLTHDDIPCIHAEALLYGKQTDRPARLVIRADREQSAVAEATLREIGEHRLSDARGESVRGHFSESELPFRTLPWFPESISFDQQETLGHAIRQDAVLRLVPDTQFARLHGKTPLQAASDPEMRRPLLAFLSDLELRHEVDRNTIAQLHDRLGVTIPAIQCKSTDAVLRLPVSQLHRVDPTKLDTERLTQLFNRATQVDSTLAIRRLGQELINRNVENAEFVHGMMSRTAVTTSEAIDHLLAAQRAAKVNGSSPGIWIVSEFDLRIARGEGSVAERLLQEVKARHLNEPEVAKALMAVLEKYKLLPPANVPRGETQSARSAENEPSSSDKAVWTPDSDRTAATAGQSASEGKSKLWMPGMD